MSESDIQPDPQRRRQELRRKLLQGAPRSTQPRGGCGIRSRVPTASSARSGACGRLETIFCTLQLERVGYALAGHDSLHPLAAALDPPAERYSLEVRRPLAEAAASRSSDEALTDLSRSTEGRRPNIRRNSWRFAPWRTSTGSTPPAVRRRASRRRRVRWSWSASTARSCFWTATTCGRHAEGGRAAPAAPGAALSVHAPQAEGRRSTRSQWRRWPPSARRRRSCGARRTSWRA